MRDITRWGRQGAGTVAVALGRAAVGGTAVIPDFVLTDFVLTDFVLTDFVLADVEALGFTVDRSPARTGSRPLRPWQTSPATRSTGPRRR